MAKDFSHNLPPVSVGELSQSLKKSVETAFSFVRVRGEISGFKRAASGHLYMSLKDENAVIDAICWRGVAGRLSIKPEDGAEVICSGKLTTYPGRSKYQIVIESMELAGEGALLKMLEERRKKLAAEGLFDAANKKPVPFLPETIGVVTSPTGAVFRDIMHRITDRFPVRVILWPALVQGEQAAEQIAAGIKGFNSLDEADKPDVMIVARGGGSLEDLWCFNEEIVVRAVYESEIPVISAVGHETDTTLIDYVSDLRAPTPTGAAEKAVPVRMELSSKTSNLDSRLKSGLSRIFQEQDIKLKGLERGLPDAHSIIGDGIQRLDERSERFKNAFNVFIDKKKNDVLGLKVKSPSEFLENAKEKTDTLEKRLKTGTDRFIKEAQEQNSLASARFARLSFNQILENKQDFFTPVTERLQFSIERLISDKTGKTENTAKLLESYSFKNVLERGFALVRDNKGKPVTNSAKAKSLKELDIEFSDGVVKVTNSSDTREPKKPTKTRKAKKDDRQGNLF